MLTAHFLSFISPSTDIRQHMVAASLPSTPDAISAYKQMVRYATPPRCSLDVTRRDFFTPWPHRNHTHRR
jgi:hypothetical protein